MADLQHECGIAALYHLPGAGKSPLTPHGGPNSVSRLMPRVLLDLQNRGQLAAGLTTYNPHREQILDTYKQIGTVIEAFRLNHPGRRKISSASSPVGRPSATSATRLAGPILATTLSRSSG